MEENKEVKLYNEAEPQDTIEYCENCYGYAPCLCNSRHYARITKFIYDAFKYCKPTI